MTPVRMLRDERIAVDGLIARWYRVGDIVNVPGPLALALCRDGIATESLTSDEAQAEGHQPKNELSDARKQRGKTRR